MTSKRHILRHMLLWTLLLAVHFWVSQPVWGQSHILLLNEVMSSNTRTFPDPQGQYDDWVEIYNPSNQAIDMGGMFLSDDPQDPLKWQCPTHQSSATIVDANGYLLVWLDNDTEDTGLHANFKLKAAGEHLSLREADGLTVIDEMEVPPLPSDTSYGTDANAGQTLVFMTTPTPGESNYTGYSGLVADTSFSHDRGFYESPITIHITSATAEAKIYYTTDGSSPISFRSNRPVPSGFLYTGPITLETTTCLRAVALKGDLKPTNVDTQTYIFPEHVLQQSAQPTGFPNNWGHTYTGDYEMDPEVVYDPLYQESLKDDLLTLPTLSLVMDQEDWFGGKGQGIYIQGEGDARAVSAELIFPDGSPGFQIDCGVMIMGGSSTNRWNLDKLSMRLKFQSQYGPAKLKHPLFPDSPVDTFDTLVVDAHYNNSWAYGGTMSVNRDGQSLAQREVAQYTRDLFACDIQKGLGALAPHGRHVHLYLNGLYWGLYWLHERPDEHFAANYFGGNAEDYDVIKHSVTKNKSLNTVNGTDAAYQELFNTVCLFDGSAEQYEEIQQRVDIPSLINYLIMNYYLGNWDWDQGNWYATFNRVDPQGRWRYHSWDAEHVMEALTADETGKYNSKAPTELHNRLMMGERYRLQFADQVHQAFFNQGLLTSERITQLYQHRLDEVDRAIVAESARWGDNRRKNPFTRDVEWVRERDWLLQQYFPNRSEIVLNQFKQRGWYPDLEAPTLLVNEINQQGGAITQSDQLSLDAPEGEIWYSTDGSDPAALEELPAPPSARILIAEEAQKKVSVGPVTSAWTKLDYDDSAWIVGTGGVGYDLGMAYTSLLNIDLLDSMFTITPSCFIRIPFTLTAADLKDLSDLTLLVRYDDGFVATLNGTEIAQANAPAEVTPTSTASSSHVDDEAIIWQPFTITSSLSDLHVGTNILALQGLNETDSSPDFLLSVVLEADVQESDTLPEDRKAGVHRYVKPLTLDTSCVVKARAYDGQTWSPLSTAVFAVGPVADNLRITELMYHPADTGDSNAPYTEYLELANRGQETINLNRVQFTQGIRFTFGYQELAAQEIVLLVKDRQAFINHYGDGLPIAGVYEGSLSNGGERIELLDALGQPIHTFTYQDNWYNVTDGQGFSLTKRSPQTAGLETWSDKKGWEPSKQHGGSPGSW